MSKSRLSSLPAILSVACLLAGCGGAAATLAPSPTPAPTSASGVPVFTVELSGSVEKTFKSDPTAVTATCTTPATGAWTILYSGGSPSIQLDLRVYQGAATSAGSKDFDLEVDAGDGGFFPMPSRDARRATTARPAPSPSRGPGRNGRSMSQASPSTGMARRRHRWLST